jgi:hypothetical protein
MIHLIFLSLGLALQAQQHQYRGFDRTARIPAARPFSAYSKKVGASAFSGFHRALAYR